MNVNEKFELIKRNTEEIIGEDELKKLLRGKRKPMVYCGYEPSGDIHIGHLVTIMKLLDFQKAGIKPIVLLANWHAWLNKKGDWKFLDNQVKIWEKGMKAAGLTKAKFVKGTDFQRKEDYINDIMVMALNTTVNRGRRSMQTVARDMTNAKVSQMIYPLMQIEDIKALDVDFVVAGMDQRKIHALGIELFSKIGMKKKPIFVHTPLIPSLKKPEKIEKEISLKLKLGESKEIFENFTLEFSNFKDPKKRERSRQGLFYSSEFMNKAFHGIKWEDKKIAKLVLKDLDGNALDDTPLMIGEGGILGGKLALYCEDIEIKHFPSIKLKISHIEPDEQKMSSFVKESLISIRDSNETIKKKISKAFCSWDYKGESMPILDILKLLIFPSFEKIEIKRLVKFGKNIVYNSYADLEKDFVAKKLHPLDLKNATADYLNKIIAPIRKAWK